MPSGWGTPRSGAGFIACNPDRWGDNAWGKGSGNSQARGFVAGASFHSFPGSSETERRSPVSERTGNYAPAAHKERPSPVTWQRRARRCVRAGAMDRTKRRRTDGVLPILGRAKKGKPLVEARNQTTSLPFQAGEHRRVAVKVIDPRGNEVMRVHHL